MQEENKVVQEQIQTPSSNNPSPFLPKSLLIVISILLLLSMAGSTYLFLQLKSQKEKAKTTQTTNNIEKKTENKENSNSDSITADWKTYTNTKYESRYHFSVKYPSDWRIREHDSGTGIDVNILSPDYKAPEIGAIENVLNGARIEIYPRPFSISNQKFSNLSDWFNNYFIHPRTKKVLYTPQETTVNIKNQSDVKAISYKNRNFDENNFAKLFLVNKDTVYEFKIISKEDLNKYMSMYDQILSTFKFTDQNKTIDTSNWKTHTNSQYRYELRFPQDWSSYIPSTDQQTLDSICLGKKPNTCVFNVTVLEGNLWDREQKLLGLTLSSQEGTKQVSFAGIEGFKRTGYFGENEALYGYVMILRKDNKVYQIWVYEKTEDKSDFTILTDQILSTFKFTQ